MLIQSIVSIAIAIASGVGLANFLNSTREEETSNLSVNNVVIGVTLAGVIVTVIRLIAKLMHSNEKVEEVSSIIKQSQKKKSKGKLKQKKILKLEKGKISEIIREEESLESEVYLINEKKEELREDKEELGIASGSNENVQEVVDREMYVEDEGWINVEKKEKRKKNKHSKGNNVDYSLRRTSSVKSIKENVIRKDQERRGDGELRRSLLKVSEKSESKTDPAQRVNDSQKASVGLVSKEPDLKRSDISFVDQENSVKVKNTPEDKYLKQGARPKTGANSGQCVSYAGKASAGLPSIGAVSEKKGSSSSVRDDVCTVATTSELVPPSIVDISSASIQSKSVSSGLCFEESLKYYRSPLYKGVVSRYSRKLNRFRELHFTYCIKLINQTFKVQNNELVVSKTVSNLFSRLTPHTVELFFILKVFLIVNLSTLCGGRGMIAHIRYCSTHFNNQSLLDLLILEVMMNPSKRRDTIKEIFEVYCKNMYDTGSYEPYSGNFFRKVFYICRSLASVNLPEEEQALADFAMLACMTYSGHMVNMLYRMLIYNGEAKIGSSVVGYINAQFFCNGCYHLKKSVIHMYHPANEKECTKSIGGIIDVPLMMWRRCSKEIDNLVIEATSQGKMDFGIFVNNMICSTKKLTLLPYTVRCYEKDIEMYDRKIRTTASLLPLPHERVMYPKEKDSSKSL